jgi:hypothetical protein
LQGAVVALVESPAPLDGNPHQVHLFERNPERLDRPFENGSESDVELVALGPERASRFQGFLGSPLGEADVGPARETVLLVPRALAVTEQH